MSIILQITFIRTIKKEKGTQYPKEVLRFAIYKIESMTPGEIRCQFKRFKNRKWYNLCDKRNKTENEGGPRRALAGSHELFD